MNKNRELVKNTLIIAIGRICTQFISFLLLPLYTALLTTDEYGIIDLVNTYIQLILPIVVLQMDQALLRFMIQNRNNENGLETCISTASILLIIQSALFSCLFLVVRIFFHNEYAIYLYANVMAMVFSGYMLQAARGLGDNVTYSTASFLSGALTVACNVIFIVGFHMKVEGMLLSSVVGNIAASVYVLFKDKIYQCIQFKTFDKVLLKNMFKYAWPLLPNALIWWVVNASDRSIVLAFMGTAASGVLAVSHKFPSLITTLYNIFHLSWTESAALHLQEKDKEKFFSDVFDTVLRFFGSMCIMMIAVMPFIFSLFVNEKFKASYYQVPIYTIAALFNIIAGLYSVIYISEMKTNDIAKTSVLAGTINVLIDFVLIKYIGLFAASISSAVAFGSMAIYRAIDIRKYIRQRLNINLIVSLFAFITFGIIIYYNQSIIAKVWYILGATIYSVVLNKSFVKKGKAIVKSRLYGGDQL